jgi:hypothetical protein
MREEDGSSNWLFGLNRHGCYNHAMRKLRAAIYNPMEGLRKGRPRQVI